MRVLEFLQDIVRYDMVRILLRTTRQGFYGSLDL